MELEPSTTEFTPTADQRPRVDPPPAVRLISVDDCQLPAAAGLEVNLDQFYTGILGFERDMEEPGLVYRAENFRLRIEVFERRPDREDFIPLGVTVPSLADLINRLLENEIEFVRQRGIAPGLDNIQLLDPAGNLIEVSEFGTAV